MDRLELAILDSLSEYSDSPGRMFTMPQLIAPDWADAGPFTFREVADALLVLHQEGMITISRYRGVDLIPIRPDEGALFFSHQQGFMCRALPKARRRREELTRLRRNGIFISHISAEKPIALGMQKLFEEGLSPAVPVFVSSDYRSIQSGDKWYQAILDGIKKSEAVIILLSPASLGRPWLNFEAGMGMGQGSVVVPVVWGGLSKGDIGLPLGQLHARDLHDGDDIKALLSTMSEVCRVKLTEKAIADFLAEIEGLTVPEQSSSR